MYFNGYAVQRNYDKAMEYYLAAANQGNSTAQFKIGTPISFDDQKSYLFHIEQD